MLAAVRTDDGCDPKAARCLMFHYAQAGDVIVMDGVEISAEALSVITNPNNRLLYAFVKKRGRVHPVAYSEERVIWLETRDEQEATHV